MPVPLRADATHDVEAMIGAVIPRTKVLLVCTPNNPTGPAVTSEHLPTILDTVRSDVLVVVDEAYVEFVRDPAAALEKPVAERGRMVESLRSMGWDVPDAQGNFVWLPAGDSALDVAAACQPVAVLPFAGEGVRVTIGTAAANDRLLETLGSFQM